MTTPIWFDSAETGAPTLNNVAGSLLEVLRACLINGFGAKTVTSIDVASGVATATAASHGFSATFGKRLLIAGCSEAALNGTKQPLSVATNTFTFDATGVADGTYTGTMSAKRAPLGWTEPHTGTNVAMFARSAPEATTMLYRINDSHAAGSTATDARVLMVESATDVDTYTAPSPTEAILSGGSYIHKGPNNSTAKQWCLVGDDRALWIFTRFDGTVSNWRLAPFLFGDGRPYSPGDAYFSLLFAAANAGGGSTSQTRGGYKASLSTEPTLNYSFASRLKSGVGAAARVAMASPGAGSALGDTTSGQTSTANIVIHTPVWVVESDGALTIRGEAPGIAEPLARSSFGQMEVVPDVGGSGKSFLSIQHSSQSSPGTMLLDLTGPWY